MSLNLTTFTRALKIHSSPYPIPSPFVLSSGTQETDGLCLEYTVYNGNNCTGYLGYNSGEFDITVYFIDCNGEQQSKIINPNQEIYLGCTLSITTTENLTLYDDGPCGPAALFTYIDCEGATISQPVYPNDQITTCAARIISLTGGADPYYEETGNNCGNFTPYVLKKIGADFILNGVSPGDIVYWFSKGSFDGSTQVVGVIDADTIQVADYISLNREFIIYQSAISGLGNQGCNLYCNIDGALVNVETVSGNSINDIILNANSVSPIQISKLTNSSSESIYAIW